MIPELIEVVELPRAALVEFDQLGDLQLLVDVVAQVEVIFLNNKFLQSTAVLSTAGAEGSLEQVLEEPLHHEVLEHVQDNEDGKASEVDNAVGRDEPVFEVGETYPLSQAVHVLLVFRGEDAAVRVHQTADDHVEENPVLDVADRVGG
eukprot:CAMPEP_0170487294 /NCGR_PEP_ID=MMETSP0208-20121228/6147_1 /TAXON_ID=197538 /ORGANISM="Strombidium inclinatum, Strain S3" /LENGTH=147 /DNA_ID=CAMNT_0010761533 /DNA_START=328 /DNA_END=771 /DNA_ORIENTATION=-